MRVISNPYSLKDETVSRRYDARMKRARNGGPEPLDPFDREVIETSRLVLELIHAGYPASEAAHVESVSDGPHRPDAGRVSRQAIRAAIVLYQHDGLTMGEVASVVGMSNGWASRVVEELVSAGLAERVADPHDRRVVHVRLVASSLGVVEAAYRWRGEAIARALSWLDADERRAVRTFLSRAIDELAAAEGPRTADPGAAVSPEVGVVAPRAGETGAGAPGPA
jgi:DNA-binding MarR family transcriptional regulator